MVKTKEVKSPKEMLKEAYRGQAEHFSGAFIEQLCLQFADKVNGKQHGTTSQKELNLNVLLLKFHVLGLIVVMKNALLILMNRIFMRL